MSFGREVKDFVGAAGVTFKAKKAADLSSAQTKLLGAEADQKNAALEDQRGAADAWAASQGKEWYERAADPTITGPDKRNWFQRTFGPDPGADGPFGSSGTDDAGGVPAFKGGGLVGPGSRVFKSPKQNAARMAEMLRHLADHIEADPDAAETVVAIRCGPVGYTVFAGGASTKPAQVHGVLQGVARTMRSALYDQMADIATWALVAARPKHVPSAGGRSNGTGRRLGLPV